MRHTLQTTFPAVSKAGTSLQSLVNQLLRHSLSEVLRKSDSSVINEIPEGLVLQAERNRLIPVVEQLLATILVNARRGRIHIRAERFKDIVILEIQDRSNHNGYALDYSIRSLEPMARMVGGFITIKGKQQLEATISFSFPNLPGNHGFDC